ncbi:MAG: 4-(cytidine 5'-diphospho)-2-C-methyl-D-erythritol kinase [Planctomycetaceae bacterium]|nr:4-(cytidine 5'-diphospho)-2-C-methyl-D-erythritol kinase [Planctomycetaceae bacterium]
MFALKSPAKINVFLEVLGRRSDGFHELETVMLRTGLHDVLEFRSLPGTSGDPVRLKLMNPGIHNSNFPLDGQNLICKAAKRLLEWTWERSHNDQPHPSAEIWVWKQIPAEAGLAGGSSNAVTTLIGLNRLWRLNLSRGELHQIAASLGSDLNFFVEDVRAAVCRGRGELVTPVECGGSFHFVAFRPPVGNSTPAVFSALKIPPADAQRTPGSVLDAIRRGIPGLLEKTAFNRLTDAARTVNPQMADMMEIIERLTGRPALMSGSGSTCVLAARNRRDAIRLQSLISMIPDTASMIITV